MDKQDTNSRCQFWGSTEMAAALATTTALPAATAAATESTETACYAYDEGIIKEKDLSGLQK